MSKKRKHEDICVPECQIILNYKLFKCGSVAYILVVVS